ncbi:MAG: hypothetical protein Q8L98_08340 [Chlamydiales bacterium]|nr:hypothetical protein [Chlamydiales bacterium]
MGDGINEQSELIPDGFLNIPAETRGKIFDVLLSCGSFSIPSPEFVSDFVSHSRDDDGSGISVYFRMAIYQINFFSAEDPLQLHYAVAREVLKEAGGSELEADERARDLLARELVKECKAFAAKIIPISFLQENSEDRSLFVITQNDEQAQHLVFEIDGRLWLDELFLKHIGGIGKDGERLAVKISAASATWMREFRDNKKASRLFRIWVDIDMLPYNCRFFKILAEVVWEDRIRERFERLKKYLPALPRIVFAQTFKPALSRKSRLKESENQIDVIGDTGKVAVSVKIPCLDKGSLKLVIKGITALGSLSGHRLLRWELKSGCQNLIDAVPDQRVLITEGGYEGIANLIGCGKSPARTSEIKAILYAQANANFYMPNGDKASSLIILQEMERHKNGEPNKIKIILGDLLFPYSLFSLPKRQRLLTPITDIPPLVGSPNTYAAQAFLQLLVLEEISNQSDRLAQRGSANISLEKWKELAKEAQLPLSCLERVIDGWTSNSTNGTVFLQRDGEEFTLSNEHSDIVRFLQEQGELRVRGAEQGRKSAQKAAKKKAGILGID